jgi:predicted metalloprotease
VESAITTAKAIGDDRLQKSAKGWVNPESFNHGTSAQRLKWFTEGLKTGDAEKSALDRFFNPNVRPLDL